MGSLAIDQKSVVLEEEIVGGGLEVREDTEGLIVLKSLRGSRQQMQECNRETLS